MKRNIKRLLVPASILFMLSCSGQVSYPGRQQEPGGSRVAAGYLTEKDAGLRSKQVSNVSYKLSIDLTAGEAVFTGRVAINFDLLNTDQPLTIDFAEGEVQNVSLNGEMIAFDYNKWFITIDSSLLKAGRQQLLIDFSHSWSTTGAGLYRFNDPEDQRVYVYSDLEPYDANRIFPCFDQPDLKATYDLSVNAPQNWQVVSSIAESAVSSAGQKRTWTFPRSEKFSTYLFSLHAGPYRVWKFQAGDIPLRLFARRSLASYVDAQDWFKITRQGLEFYQDYFGIRYPFHKYDQLIVPDFNAGAMENVAAVTYSEYYIKRGAYTREEKESIAGVILHEMAHMWFGDLVTMDWWNGLWLNESFATYMSHLAMVKNTAYTHAWHGFYSVEKLWAYTTDERVTNHPIELAVDNTDSGFANFDGITYGKGAAVLKQLFYLIGPEAFRQGVSQYLRQHAYKNTRLADFIAALATASGRDLQEWTRQWLYTKGLNSITADYQCEQGRITTMRLSQDSPPAPYVLREHRLQLGLFVSDENRQMKLVEAIPVTVKGRTTELTGLTGMVCPDFVYPNYADWAYVKVRLPEREHKLLHDHINGFAGPLLRSMLWRNLWEAVRDARLPLTEYADIVLANIAVERDPKTLRQVLRSIRSSMNYFYSFQLAHDSAVEQYASRFEALAWSKVRDYADNIDLQKMWLDYAIPLTHSPAGLDNLAALLSGGVTIPGLVLDQDRRWAMVKQLSEHRYAGLQSILEREKKRDPSNNGEKSYIAAQVASPQMDNKRAWLQKIQHQYSGLSLAELRAAMEYLYSSYQMAFTQALMGDVLAPLAKLDAGRRQQYMRFYTRYLLGPNCSAASKQVLRQAMQDNKASSLVVTRALKIALQEDQRCLNIRASVRTDGMNE